ncbi:hypothetical protein DFQ26_000291 [Actinomortierella ambigua]|nr:hypothetical protein DFQ26_000291 [Actinomortierella ambigua]
MPKRSSSPPARQTRRPQKLQRPDDGVPPHDIASPQDIASQNDGSEGLMEKLALAICKDRALEGGISTVQYLVSLKSSAAPTPTYEGFVGYMAGVDIQLSPRSSRKAWSQIKQFFSSDSEDLSIYENLVDVQSLTAAFREASESGSSGSVFSPAAVMPPPPPLMTRLTVSSSASASASASPSPPTRASRTPSGSPGSSTSKSTSSRSKAVPGQILTMKSLFKRNFDKFGGGSWVLPSGAIVDERLREVIEALSQESALHSFVIEDVDALLELFDDVEDKKEIIRTMVTRQDEEFHDLSEAELNFLEQYNKSPEDLHRFLGELGYHGVGRLLEEEPSEEFQIIAHDCITRVLRCYQRDGYAFPRDLSEAWFNHHLWGFLPDALSDHSLFVYRPGEITSESSAHRRRKQDEREGRQQMGHKVDGMVVVRLRTVEICWMEAAKRDGGLNTTKSLHDTLKLMKLMKDGHDMVREKAVEDVRYRLATYSLRISGPSVSIISLRQRPGRFYQAVEEETISLPATWTGKEDTTQVLAVIARVLKLRKALQAMASSINAWTQSTIKSKTTRVKDCIAPTMTSPQLLPVTLAGSFMAAPPLNI